MVGTVCSVYEAVIARCEVVALAYVVVVWSVFDWHLRLFELLADLGRPLRASQLCYTTICSRIGSPRPGHTGRTYCCPFKACLRGREGAEGTLKGGTSMIGYIMHATLSPTRSCSATAAKSSSRHAPALPNFDCHPVYQSAFARRIMFSRTIPRAAPRISAFARCEAQRPINNLTKLSNRTWKPSSQPLGRRYRSTIREQFREQYYKSPVLFPFALGV